MKQLFMFTTYMKIKQNHYLKNGSSNRIYKNVIYKKNIVVVMRNMNTFLDPFLLNFGD